MQIYAYIYVNVYTIIYYISTTRKNRPPLCDQLRPEHTDWGCVTVRAPRTYRQDDSGAIPELVEVATAYISIIYDIN